MKAIRKVLIANRGEIAVRIMRTAKARGLATVAVYSDADAGAYHVRCADEAIRIGPPEAARSYLDLDAIIAAAKAAGADAIHPGYGFASEDPAFAEACAANAVAFVGPPAHAIAAMADKGEAKRRMIAAGVPCVPGYHDADQSEERLAAEAERIGFPLMLKASAGGGGRGMRLVENPGALKEAIASARRESESAFGDGRLIIEKAVAGARHVEVQVLADAHGNVIHLGDRDCSLQRRRQKVIEEAPSPAVAPDIRRRMGEAAVNAARAVGYQNAGTVEFLFDPKSEEFYFLEMNTRLQVEHPVTEMVTGLDLVALQFDIAEGKELILTQDDVRCDGWAIEARLYAEDPSQGFLPQSGRVAMWRTPQIARRERNGPPPPHSGGGVAEGDGGGEGGALSALARPPSGSLRSPPPPQAGEEGRSRRAGVRIDGGIEDGDSISTFYDPMVAKLIAHGATRDEARAELIAALKATILLGVPNNRDFLIALLEDDAFASGSAATDYIEANLDRLTRRKSPGGEAALALAAAALIDRPFGDLLTGWASRGSASFPLRLSLPNGDIMRADAAISGRRLEVRNGQATAAIEIVGKTESEIHYVSKGRPGWAAFARNGAIIDVDADGASARYADVALAPATEMGAGADAVLAPMAGAVTSIVVRIGDAVTKGQTVATIEAMKMEHHLKAPRDGIVAAVNGKAGDQIAIRAKIVALEPGAQP